MIRSFYIATYVLMSLAASTQNLVPNHSFESIISCPPSIGAMNFVADWEALNNHTGSPDLLHVCAGDPLVDVPNNFWGSEFAATGSAYAGLIAITNLIPGFREYIQVQLSQPLTAGQEYSISFKYSLADKSIFATDQLGILLSDTLVSGVGSSVALNMIPQLTTPSVLLQDQGWEVIDFSYIALGGEQFLVVGNFSDDPSTQLYPTGSIIYDGCYIYLDDFGVVACNDSLNIGKDTVLCQGESITLDVRIPNAAYLWQDSSTSSSYDVTGPGIYWVEVVDGCGIRSDTIVVDYKYLTDLDLGNDTSLCPGDQLTLNAALPDAAYTWQDNSVDPYYVVTATGQYSVQVVDQCHTLFDTINVAYYQPNLIQLPEDTAVCDGDTLILDVSYPGASYLWQDSTNLAVYEVTQPGIYWVQVTDSCAVESQPVEVSYEPVPSVVLGPDTFLCLGDFLIYDVSVPGASYLWQDQNSFPFYTVTQPGAYAVTVSIGTCSAADTVQVSLHEVLGLDLGADTTVCSNDTVLLHPQLLGVVYTWQDGSTAPDFTAVDPGLYWVEVSDGCGFARDSIYIFPHTNLMVNLGADTVLCPGATLDLGVSMPGVTYLWQDLSSDSTFLVTYAGSYWVWVTDHCEQVSDTIAIDYVEAPNLDLGNDTVICMEDRLRLEPGIAGATYLWSDQSTAPALAVAAPGHYWVEATVDGCSFRDSIRVEHYPELQLELGSFREVCEDGSLTIEIPIEDVDYLWHDQSTDRSITVTEPGLVWVRISNACLAASDTLAVRQVPLPRIDLPVDTTMCYSESLLLNVIQPRATYVWQNGSTAPVFNVEQPGTYSVRVENPCGVARKQFEVVIEDCGCDVFVPNAFTPNSDGENDVFHPFTNCVLEGYALSIFNRIGELVYASEDQAEGWDAFYKGARVPVGTYLYRLTYQLPGKPYVVKEGSLAVLY